jgi:O-antigen/teichoic acid export membrane protein
MTPPATSKSSLGAEVVRGGFWVSTLRIIERIFYLLRIVVLARLLSPDDFGLFGIALLSLSCLETLSEIGFKQAFIQKKEDAMPYLNVTWTVQVFRGVLIALVLFFAAPYISTFFETPLVEPILIVIGFSFVLQSLTNAAVFHFEKELRFRKYFVYQFAGTVVDIVVAISAALILRSVWALILGLLAGNLTRCVVSYVIDPYRPRVEWDFRKFKEFLGFGKWVLGSSVLVFLLSHGHNVFVGRFFDVAMLGFYQMAFRISNMPATEITHVISRVTFPAYSKLQENTAKLREAYLKVLRLTAFLSIPLAGMLFVLAPEFTKVVMGDKWMPMVPAMRVFCILGAIRSIVATMGSVFYGAGVPRVQAHLSTMQLLIMIALIYPLTLKWGIAGTAAAVVLNNLAAPWGFKKMFDLVDCRFRDFFRSLLLPVGITSVMCLFLQTVKNLLSTGVVSLCLLMISGLGVYLASAYLADRTINRSSLTNDVRWAIRTLRARTQES